MVDWGRCQSWNRFEWWLVRGIRMAASRDEFLSAFERSNHVLGVWWLRCLLQHHHVVALFFFDMLGEISPEGFDGRDKFPDHRAEDSEICKDDLWPVEEEQSDFISQQPLSLAYKEAAPQRDERLATLVLSQPMLFHRASSSALLDRQFTLRQSSDERAPMWTGSASAVSRLPRSLGGFCYTHPRARRGHLWSLRKWESWLMGWQRSSSMWCRKKRKRINGKKMISMGVWKEKDPARPRELTSEACRYFPLAGSCPPGRAMVAFLELMPWFFLPIESQTLQRSKHAGAWLTSEPHQWHSSRPDLHCPYVLFGPIPLSSVIVKLPLVRPEFMPS